MIVDEQTHSAFLADDYRAVHFDGTVNVGKPSAKEIAAEPSEDYRLRDREVWPVVGEGAMATYTAEGLSAEGFPFAVG